MNGLGDQAYADWSLTSAANAEVAWIQGARFNDLVVTGGSGSGRALAGSLINLAHTLASSE